MARSKKTNKEKRTMFPLILVIIIGVLAIAALSYLFGASPPSKNLIPVVLQTPQTNQPATTAYTQYYNTSKGCAEKILQSHIENQSYQYEGNPCHLFYINASVSDINYTLNGGVDAAVYVYNNMLLVPMSQPMTLAMMTNVSMTNMSAPKPLISNLPFTLPSYYPPMNWSNVWGKLAAYNATTGRLIWEDNFSAPVMSQPLVVNNTIYVSTGSDFVDFSQYRNGIYAINATTGSFIWNVSTIPEHMPTPVYYNNTLIIVPGAGTGTDSQYLMALDPENGEPLWYLFIGGESAMSSPTLVGNMIYFGVRLAPSQLNIYPQRTALFAVNLNTKRVAWITYFKANFGTEDAPPAVWNNIVVAGYAYSNPMLPDTTLPQSAEGTNSSLENLNVSVYLVGLNATTGKQTWGVYAGTGVNPPRSKIPAPTIYNGIVYSDNTVTGTLLAINVTTGKVLWSYHTGLSDPNPAIIDNHVLDINQTGWLFVLNMNGTLTRKMNLGLAMGWCGSGQLAQVGNNLVIGGENNRIVTLPVSKVITA